MYRHHHHPHRHITAKRRPIQVWRKKRAMLAPNRSHRMIRAAAARIAAAEMNVIFNWIRAVRVMIPMSWNKPNRCAVWIQPKPIQRHNCPPRHRIQALSTAIQWKKWLSPIANSINRPCGSAPKTDAFTYTTAPITFARKRTKSKFNWSAQFIPFCKF